MFDSGARLQGQIRSCSGATSFPVFRSKIFATTPAPNFVGEPINPKTIKKKDVWASFLSLKVFSIGGSFHWIFNSKKKQNWLQIMPPLLIITKPYISVSISKKNTVYTNFVYLNYGKLIAIQYLQSASRQMTHHDWIDNICSPIYLHWPSLFLTGKTILAPQFIHIDPLSSWLWKQY